MYTSHTINIFYSVAFEERFIGIAYMPMTAFFVSGTANLTYVYYFRY